MGLLHAERLTLLAIQNTGLLFVSTKTDATCIGKKIKTTYILILVSSIIPHKKKPGSLEKELIPEVGQEEYKGEPGPFR